MRAVRTIAAALAAALTTVPAAAIDRPAPGVTEVAPDGTVTWVDPDTGRRYRLAPQIRTAHGRQCREYIAAGIVDGAQVQTYGTVCRQPDGAWRLAN